MKIGILLISEIFAGAERTIKELLIHSNKKDYILLVNEEIYDYYNNLGIKLYNLGLVFNQPKAKRLFRIKNILKQVNKIIEDENIAILNPILDYSFLLSILTKRETKVICSLHGDEIERLKEISRFIQSKIIKRALKNSIKLISVSKGLVSNIPKKYKQKTVVIPNGVDSQVFKPLKKLKQRKNVILFVGRFIEIKGIQEILNVAKKLHQYEFWFAGQGELEKEIKGKNIKNLGFKTTEELVKLYNQATISICPSYRESFGLVGLEAMSCGRAVIATPLGFSEYIENGKDGIIIPSKDEDALKNAIVDLMINEKKRKMLEKNARKKALQYSWDKIANRYMEVFREVITK